MRFGLTRAASSCLIAALVFAAPASAGDDLTLPPDLRDSAAPPPAPSLKQTKPKSAKQQAERSKLSTVSTPAAAAPPPASTTEAVRPKSKPAEDPLSFGMKWNATNDPNFGPSTSSLLNEYHHDLNGQPTGAGGQVGFKYKF